MAGMCCKSCLSVCWSRNVRWVMNSGWHGTMDHDVVDIAFDNPKRSRQELTASGLIAGKALAV